MATNNDGFVRNPSGVSGRQGPVSGWGTYGSVNPAANLGFVQNFIPQNALESGGGSSRNEKTEVLNTFSQQQDIFRKQRDQNAISNLEWRVKSMKHFEDTVGVYGAYTDDLKSIYTGFEQRTGNSSVLSEQDAILKGREKVIQQAAEWGLIGPNYTEDDVSRAANFVQQFNQTQARLSYAQQQLNFDSSLSQTERAEAQYQAKQLSTRQVVESTNLGVENMLTIFQTFSNPADGGQSLTQEQALAELDNVIIRANSLYNNFEGVVDNSTRQNLMATLEKTHKLVRDKIVGKESLDIAQVRRQLNNETEAARILGESGTLRLLGAVNLIAPNFAQNFPVTLSHIEMQKLVEKRQPDGTTKPGSFNDSDPEFIKHLGKKVGEVVGSIRAGYASTDDKEAFNTLLEQIGLAGGNTGQINPATIRPLLDSLSSPQVSNVIRQIPLSDRARDGLNRLQDTTIVNAYRSQQTNYFNTAVVPLVGGGSSKLFDQLEVSVGPTSVRFDLSNNVQTENLSTSTSTNLNNFASNINKAIQFYANVNGLEFKEAVIEHGHKVAPRIFPPEEIARGSTIQDQQGNIRKWNGQYPYSDINNFQIVSEGTNGN